MVEDPFKYGKVIQTDDYGKQTPIAVADFVQATYKDSRLISVAGLADNTFIIAVENPESTGRNPKQQMRLTKESLVGLLSTIMLYYDCKQEDLIELTKGSINHGKIDYQCSDNLKQPE